MAGWYSLWSFGIFFPFWYDWTKKNLATMVGTHICTYVHIFLGTTYQKGKNVSNDHKLYKMVTKYTKWSQNIPNGHKINQMPPKFTQLWFEHMPSGNTDYVSDRRYAFR
jgi:hypothetical protein